jgi:hypothetical protein
VFDQTFGMSDLVAGKVCHEVVRLVRDEKLAKIERPLLQDAQRRSDAAGDRKLDKRLELRRPCDANVDRHADARLLQSLRPTNDRS